MSDPKMILSGNGARLHFDGGNPVMDDGLENMALISLFTAPGWCGNQFLKVPIGSDFEAACNQPITHNTINLIRNAAEMALNSFGKVSVSVINPQSHRLEIRALIEQTGQELVLSRGGINWQQQGTNPAYLKPSARVPGIGPSELGGIRLVYSNGTLTAVWDAPTDYNVLHGGYIIIQNETHDFDPIKYLGSSTGAVLQYDSSFSFFTEDSSGNRSAKGIFTASSVPQMDTNSQTVTLNQVPSFTGTKTNCSVVNGRLVLNVEWLMDSFVGNWDDLTGNIDDYPGNAEQTGTYEFEKSMPAILPYTIAFQKSTGTLEVSTSDDDVTWSAYSALAAGVYTTKSFRFRLTLSTTTPGTPIEVTTLSVTVDPVVIFQSGTVTAPADVVFGTPYNKPEPDFFYTIYSLGNVKKIRRGEDVITSLNSTGFSTNLPAGTRLDWYTKGY